jgi:hypothetical protein
LYESKRGDRKDVSIESRKFDNPKRRGYNEKKSAGVQNDGGNTLFLGPRSPLYEYSECGLGTYQAC